MTNDFLPDSAWATWRKAGADFARQCAERRVSVVRLGEESYRYAASRGLSPQYIIRRAFVEGYSSFFATHDETAPQK